ncbi:unnamed protein product, partial [Schistosoma intercalatum]
VNNATSRNTSADKSSDSRTIKSATKSPGNKTIGITGQKSGSTRGTSAKIDFNQAHWKMRIICNNSNDIKIINMDNKILEIKALKRAWEEMEPGRAIRAELSRARYLEEYGLMNKLDNKTIVDDSGSTITIKSDDNLIQIIKDHSLLDHTLLLDPSKIYILKFPPELNRTLYPIQLMNLNKFYHHFNEIECKRIEQVQSIMNAYSMNSWFILEYSLKQIQCLSYKNLNEILKFKYQLFNDYLKNLKFKYLNLKKKQNQYKQNYIDLLKTIQFATDEAHYKYYEMCMNYRNNIIKQYKNDKETSCNQTMIEHDNTEPILNRIESVKKSTSIKSSRSSKSSSKSRSNSNQRRN